METQVAIGSAVWGRHKRHRSRWRWRGRRLRFEKEGGVGDDEAEVDVDGRGDAGLELEATELHGRDLVELEDQALHQQRGCHSLGIAFGF